MHLRHYFSPTPGMRFVRDLMVRLRLLLSARLWALRAAPARRRLRDSVPGVRRISAGPLRLYGRMVSGYTAAGAAAADLEQVCSLLETADVPYFLIRAEGYDAPRQVIGVEASFREAVLVRAAQQFARTPRYVGAVGADGTVTHAVLWADGALPRALRRAAVLRTGVIRLGPSGQPLSGLETGCDIEFWHRGRDLDTEGTDPSWLTVPGQRLSDVFGAALIAPRSNPVTEV
ncbi:hypothetical protein O3S80_52635, partial [Streptomyces sp. Lzd4kr]|nr:hypothetical protein [Streptomyces sp. Lzd4kr]